MSKGIPARPFQLFTSGGIDTKTDPRLVPAGELLEVENMFYQRTGELRLRNGMAQLTGAALTQEITGMWADAKGNPTVVGRTPSSYPFLSEQKYASNVGWEPTNRSITAYPSVTCERITGTSGETEIGLLLATGTAAPVDGDVCWDGLYELHTWNDANIASSTMKYTTRKTDTIVENNAVSLGTSSRPPIAVNGGAGAGARLCTVAAAGTAVRVTVFNNGLFSTVTDVANTLDNTAPWIDAQAIRNTNTIIIAWKKAGANVGALIFDPTTATITVGPVNIAADASQAIGFLDNFAVVSGNSVMVTAGATSGVVCRTLSQITLAASATDIIDATATAGVRQVTGHLNGSITNYSVHWDVAGSPLYLTVIKRGDCIAGVTTVKTHLQGFSIYSRSFLGPDNRHYLLAAYDSATQPMYVLFGASQNDVLNTTFCAQMPICVVFPGSGNGRRANQSSLTSVYFDSQNRLIMSISRRSVGGIVSMERVAFSFSKPIRTRELGGLLLSSGGIVMQSDGSETKWATMIMYPEPVSAVSTPGGSMTAGKTYSYVAVYADNDALGNRIRSAKSVPVSVVIASGQGSATLTLQNPRTPPRYLRNQTVEIYRAGPAEDGAVNYNKVGETYSNPVGGAGTLGPDTLTFIDTMADLAAQAGEVLYSTGNVLENFVTPSTKLLEVANSRLWIASAETPDELWPSKVFKPGTGVNFNPDLAFRVTGDGYGAITALAAMDGRLIVFKSSAIYPITGNGPNDLGQGSFNPPVACSLSIGTTNPASVLATPDGVLFQSPKGQMWMLDRGLGTTPVGSPVEQYTLAENIVASSLVTGATQARFVMPSGRCLVYDWLQKKWTTFLLRVQGSTVVACADIPGGWCYACADGRVYQETAGVYSDVNSVSTIAIIPIVTFPILPPAGVNGFARVREVNVVGEYVGDHTLIATLTGDYDLVASTPQQRAITAGGWQFSVKPANQKGTAYRLRLTSTHAAGSGAFRLTAATLWAALKTGSSVPYTKRLA